MKILASARLIEATLTTRTVEKAIKQKFGYDVKLQRDPSGYYYFHDPDGSPIRVGKWYSTSVNVYRLNQLPLAEWLNEFEALMKENKDRK